MTRIAKTLTVVILILLSACGYETLYSSLDEQQANEMLALLLSDGIECRKKSIDKNWALQIERRDLPRAVELLKFHGYPRDNYQSLGDIFKKEGFVSSPLEERARLLHGLSQELGRTLSSIDGVITARVHLAIPEKNILSDEKAPSSVSVFIKHLPRAKINNQVASIKALVVNSVEGLSYDNVTVTLFPAESMRAHSVPVDSAASPGLKRTYLQMSVGVSALVLLAFYGYRWIAAWRLKKGNHNG